MYTINVNKECGCFKRSEFENNMTFTQKDNALMQAGLMVNYMNNEFCGKHGFELSENQNTFQITMGDPQQQNSSCCGGGHCS